MTPGLKRWRRSLARAPLTWAKRSGLGCHSHRFILYANRRNSKATPTTSAGAAVNAYTACCDEVDPYSILKSHGCLLRRPQKEDRRSRRKASNEKERGRPSVRGEPLF